MPTSLQALLDESRFRIELRTTAAPAVLAAPLEWAHSSDLPDPTPWLTEGGLLLTDGVQFLDDASSATVDPYVRRLTDHGVRALGFATNIVHDRIPPALRDACATHGLPLLDVAATTPFMGIIRFVSDAVAADQRARLERSLAALRAVTRAALRPDGLAAILRELEKSLGCWVALFDGAGQVIPVLTQHPLPPTREDDVAIAVRATLARGRTAARRVSIPGLGDVTLQTLGHSDNLRGVLAVGTGAPLDRADSDLVESVIALSSIALEQSRTLDSARRRLRSGILELLASGVTDVAGRTVRHLWGPLPVEPIRVGCVVLDAGTRSDSLLAALELSVDDGGGRLFFAERDEHVFVITTDNAIDDLRPLLRHHDARVGFSGPSRWAGVRVALTEARNAARRTSAKAPFVKIDDLAAAGLLDHLAQTGARDIARRLLEPLDADPDGIDLRDTLRVWLTHNGAWVPAARALGIHRHTLRSRVDTAAALLGRDPDSFADRAEIWQALALASDD